MSDFGACAPDKISTEALHTIQEWGSIFKRQFDGSFQQKCRNWI
jgi:hypothetical protein